MQQTPMRYSQQETESAVSLEPQAPPTAAVIWLHGLGADGFDFVPFVPELRLPSTSPVRFIFPHAAVRPVTVNNGYPMRAWYDIKVLSSNALAEGRTEDAAGIRQSGDQVRDLIALQVASGIPSSRIVVAGFSQGGAIALHAALRYPDRLAGVIALSTYLPLRDTLADEAAAANRDVPVLMCHGSADPVVPLTLGERSREVLARLGYAVDWRMYPMQHQVCAEEVLAIRAWLLARLGDRPA